MCISRLRAQRGAGEVSGRGYAPAPPLATPAGQPSRLIPGRNAVYKASSTATAGHGQPARPHPACPGTHRKVPRVGVRLIEYIRPSMRVNSTMAVPWQRGAGHRRMRSWKSRQPLAPGSSRRRRTSACPEASKRGHGLRGRSRGMAALCAAAASYSRGQTWWAAPRGTGTYISSVAMPRVTWGGLELAGSWCE